MKVFLMVALMLTSLAVAAQQQEEMVSVPKSKLTDQQRADLEKSSARSWVGMGKEIGEAVNSSMQAITTQSNNFAQTPVGKLTVFIVIWKVIGDQAIHVLGGFLEVLVFVPIWLWSYRRTCMTRRVKTGKDAWQVVEYKPEKYGDCTPRMAHMIAAATLIVVIALTTFTY